MKDNSQKLRDKNNKFQRDFKELIGSIFMVLGALLIISNATTLKIPLLDDISLEHSYVIFLFGLAAAGFNKVVELLLAIFKK